jgi:RNA-binding protein
MLTSKQRGFLSKLATSIDPTVMVGKDGASEAVKRAIQMEFAHRELLKVRFVASKEERDEAARGLAEKTGAELVRVIGNVAILFRPLDDPKKRTVELPS